MARGAGADAYSHAGQLVRVSAFNLAGVDADADLETELVDRIHPGTQTTSTLPEPNVWYAMSTPPAWANRVSGIVASARTGSVVS